MPLKQIPVCSLRLSLCVLLGLPKLARSDEPVMPRGIFAVASYVTDMPEEIMRHPAVAGVFLRTSWAKLQPGPDTYDWSSVDDVIDRARVGNKRVSIGVSAGNFTPPWLFRQGVPRVAGTILPVGGGKEHAVEVVVPAVWDPRFRQGYANLLIALAAHLRTTDRYEMIALIKICGINENSAEMRLPHQAGAKTNTAGTATDMVPPWQAVGYRPSLVIAAFEDLARAHAAAFPDKPLGLAVITPEWHAFPPINEEGRLCDLKEVDTTRRIVRRAVEMFGARLEVQWNALTGDREPPKIVDEARRLGARIAYQENIGATRTLLFQYKERKLAAPYPDAPIRAMIDMGTKHGMAFLELFPLTINSFPEAMNYAKESLGGATTTRPVRRRRRTGVPVHGLRSSLPARRRRATRRVRVEFRFAG